VSQQELLVQLGLNLLLVLVPLYAIQGLAVLRHFFQKARLPRPLQGVGFGLFALQPLLLVAVACLGLTDLWVDFRKIRGAPTPA
jgi:membrane protein required for beta-lactamase induction